MKTDVLDKIGKQKSLDKAVRKMQLIQELMSNTAKFAPGEKKAVLKAMGISSGSAGLPDSKKEGGLVKRKKKKSIMLKGRGGKFKGIK